MTEALLKDVIAYVLKNYPHKSDLSNARLTKIIYLADWHQAINHRRQITTIDWYFDNYGPFVRDVKKEIDANPAIFTATDTRGMFGQFKMQLSLNDTQYTPSLDAEQRVSLDHIIANTNHLNWSDFIKLVYSTYPVASSSRYSQLNLIEKAQEYQDQEQFLG